MWIRSLHGCRWQHVCMICTRMPRRICGSLPRLSRSSKGCWMNLSDNRRIEYLTASDLYNLNDEVTGGHTYVRDVHLLNSAAKRPAIVVFGEEQFPTLIDKAAALLHSLAYHHLFADGNKRTALRAVTLFLEKN